MTLALMALALVVGLRRDPSREAPDDTAPDDAILTLVRAGTRGDVDSYLACFGGELRSRMEAHARSFRPPGRFAEVLRQRFEGLKGSATSRFELFGPTEATLEWETVYASHNERFRVRFHLVDGRWRVVELDSIDRRVPDVPYGTPVFPENPPAGEGR